MKTTKVKRFGVHGARSAAKPASGMHYKGKGHMGHPEYTAPHNRARAGTTTPRGAPGKKSGTTIPKLPKVPGVADVLNFKFPKG